VLCLHHLSLKAPIRLLLRAAIGGFRGIGVFHALVGRYQRPPTHILWGGFPFRSTRGHLLLCSFWAEMALDGLEAVWPDRPPSACPTASPVPSAAAAQMRTRPHLIADPGPREPFPT